MFIKLEKKRLFICSYQWGSLNLMFFKMFRNVALFYKKVTDHWFRYSQEEEISVIDAADGSGSKKNWRRRRRETIRTFADDWSSARERVQWVICGLTVTPVNIEISCTERVGIMHTVSVVWKILSFISPDKDTDFRIFKYFIWLDYDSDNCYYYNNYYLHCIYDLESLRHKYQDKK